MKGDFAMTNLVSAATAFRSTINAYEALKSCSTIVEYENKIMAAISEAIRRLCYNVSNIELIRNDNMTREEFYACHRILEEKLEALGYTTSVVVRNAGEEYEEDCYDDCYGDWYSRYSTQEYDAMYITVDWKLDAGKVDCWSDDEAKNTFRDDLLTALAAQ